MDISLELLILQETSGFFDQGFMASGLQDPPLMKGKRTEITSPKASPAADKTELHFRYGRDAARLLIGRMVRPHIRITVDIIHLHLTERLRRRILHHVQMLSVRLDKPLPRKWIRIAILRIEATGIQKLIASHILVPGQHDPVIDTGQIFCLIDRSLDKCQITDSDPALQRFRDLHD